MRKSFILIVFLLIYFFLKPTSVLAKIVPPGSPYSGYDFTISSPRFVSEGSGGEQCPISCDYPSQCANTENADNCKKPTCPPGGNTWTTYNLNCVMTAVNTQLQTGTCEPQYSIGAVVYSNGDKCISSGPYLNPGYCTSPYGGPIYKTCCSNTDNRLSPFTCVPIYNLDNAGDIEGRCPAGYEREVRCGDNGIPCGQSACGPTTTTPTSTCSDGIQNGNETGIDCGGSCPNACPAAPPPPGTTGGGGACGEYINGALDKPLSGSTVSSPVTFSGRYWCQQGKCTSFTPQPENSWIGVDIGPNDVGGTQYRFSDGGSMDAGRFSKSINLTPGTHTVFVHIEGWLNEAGRNVWVRVSNLGSCSSQTINVVAPIPTPTLNSFSGPACYSSPYTASLTWSGTAMSSTSSCPNGFWVDIA